MSPALLVLLSVVVCALLVAVLRPLAISRRWVDVPHGRKQHPVPTPLTGGIAIFGSLLCWLAWDRSGSVSLRAIALAAGLLFIVAVLDDRKPIRARYRLLTQVAAAFIILIGDQLALAPMAIANDFRLFWNGWWSFAGAAFGIVAMINAYNMADGVDGAAGGFVAVTLIALVSVFVSPLAASIAEAQELLKVTLIVLGSTLGFLLFKIGRAHV